MASLSNVEVSEFSYGATAASVSKNTSHDHAVFDLSTIPSVNMQRNHPRKCGFAAPKRQLSLMSSKREEFFERYNYQKTLRLLRTSLSRDVKSEQEEGLKKNDGQNEHYYCMQGRKLESKGELE